MTTPKKKTFTVQMRYVTWLEFPIQATTFDEAVTAAKLLKPKDTIESYAVNVNVIDYEKLPGFGVIESW
jgi:hypothetical protein